MGGKQIHKHLKSGASAAASDVPSSWDGHTNGGRGSFEWRTEGKGPGAEREGDHASGGGGEVKTPARSSGLPPIELQPPSPPRHRDQQPPRGTMGMPAGLRSCPRARLTPRRSRLSLLQQDLSQFLLSTR
ncbi:hypothetical protein PLEOSDRAFT_1091991 [Pleurotus ostreatus PC15]|uniref:Uncharacterized protein n=1 Tax=Pleurotus ostreatus (strain PC15) TaxID=1137138 RepID=A0A067P7H0_PLEO1|nr:hypothetical protein PLEOSDRAFT_1091991 [Pleurotus ostreatus PC15]